jgi:hypothetical protein
VRARGTRLFAARRNRRVLFNVNGERVAAEVGVVARFADARLLDGVIDGDVVAGVGARAERGYARA